MLLNTSAGLASWNAAGGSVSYPLIEITISSQGALLQQLPLLHEVDSSTSSSKEHNQSEEEIEASYNGRQTADFMLPCPVWGMVSLLLLLDGTPMKPWFGDTSSDPGLVQHTLQVLNSCIFDTCSLNALFDLFLARYLGVTDLPKWRCRMYFWHIGSRVPRLRCHEKQYHSVAAYSPLRCRAAWRSHCC
jgi:hypothetical protein